MLNFLLKCKDKNPSRRSQKAQKEAAKIKDSKNKNIKHIWGYLGESITHKIPNLDVIFF